MLAICDSEHSYAVLLTKQLLRIPGNRLEIRNFTDIEKLKEYAADKVMAYLVVSEEYKEQLEEIEALRYFYLTEDKTKIIESTLDNGHQTYLYRYQPAQEIYYMITGSRGEEDAKVNPNTHAYEPEVKGLKAGRSEAKFIGVYQPVHRNGCTTVAKSICKIIGKKEKVLYINLEEYPGQITKELEMAEVELGEGNLGDILYYLKQSKDIAMGRLAVTPHKLSDYHMLAPIGVSQELRQISWAQWQGFLELLRESDYECVIFDVHSSMEGFLELLDQCHIVYCPEIVGRGSPEKYKNFQQEMKLLGRTQMLLKMEHITIPEYHEDVLLKVEETLRKILDQS